MAQDNSSFQALLRLLAEHPHEHVPWDNLHPAQVERVGAIASIQSLWQQYTLAGPSADSTPLPTIKSFNLVRDVVRSAQVKVDYARRVPGGSSTKQTWLALANATSSLDAYLRQLEAIRPAPVDADDDAMADDSNTASAAADAIQKQVLYC